jgi:hypothetical protein
VVLEPEHEDLLAALVDASRDVPRESREERQEVEVRRFIDADDLK